jgi:hypothetical protein
MSVINKQFNEWKLIEILFHEDVKILKNKGLQEYYSFANTLLTEFLNPQLSYDYEKIVRDSGELMFKLKYEDDPYFVVTLKKGGLNENHYWILDFYFPEKDNGFDKQKDLKGKNYLDTISKIFKDEILPFIEKNQYPTLYFKAYSKDSYGNLRIKVFSKIVDKFVDKKIFDIEKKPNEFIIRKKQKI